MNIPSMQDLLSAGVHFGHQVRRGHPRMKPYIYGARDGVHIIDLAQSEDKLKLATEAAFNLGKEGKVMLVVGTKKQAKEIVQALATEANTPFLTERWIGGLLTNFDEVKKNLKKLSELKEKQTKNELGQFTKKERLLISRKLARFDKEMGGISEMNSLPNALFVVDAVSSDVAVKEASKMGITILGLTDTNADPSSFDYPIPANDDGIKSIKLVCETVLKAYAEGKKKASVAKQAEADEQSSSANKKAAEEKKALDKKDTELDTPVAEEAAAIEEEIEKKIVKESDGKVE